MFGLVHGLLRFHGLLRLHPHGPLVSTDGGLVFIGAGIKPARPAEQGGVRGGRQLCAAIKRVRSAESLRIYIEYSLPYEFT